MLIRVYEILGEARRLFEVLESIIHGANNVEEEKNHRTAK